MRSQELVDLFFREADRFAKVYPRVEDVRFWVKRSRYILPNHRKFRDLGYAELDGEYPIVALHYRVLRMPRQNVLGLIRHELGHVADLDWRRPGAEQRADDIAERVTGTKIRYDSRDIQTVGRGKYPRPLYLHR